MATRLEIRLVCTTLTANDLKNYAEIVARELGEDEQVIVLDGEDGRGNILVAYNDLSDPL